MQLGTISFSFFLFRNHTSLSSVFDFASPIFFFLHIENK